jgi:hypothetical protein
MEVLAVACPYMLAWARELTWKEKASNEMIGEFLHSVQNLILFYSTPIFEIVQTGQNMGEVLSCAEILFWKRRYRGEEVFENIDPPIAGNYTVIH